MNPILSSTVEFDSYIQNRLQRGSSAAPLHNNTSRSNSNSRGSTRPPVPNTTTHQPIRPQSSSASNRPGSASASNSARKSQQVETSNQYFQANTSKYQLDSQAPSYSRPTSASTTARVSQTGTRPRKDEDEMETLEFVHSWKQHLRPPSANPAAAHNKLNTAFNALVIDTDDGLPTSARSHASVHIPTAATSATVNRNRYQPQYKAGTDEDDEDELSRYSSVSSIHFRGQSHRDEYNDDEPKPKSPLRYKPLQHLDQRFPPSPVRTMPDSKINFDFVYSKPVVAASRTSFQATEDDGKPYLGVRFRVKFLQRFFYAWKDRMKEARLYFKELVEVVHHTFVVIPTKRNTLQQWHYLFEACSYHRVKQRRRARKLLLNWKARAALHARLYYRADSIHYLNMLRKGFYGLRSTIRNVHLHVQRKEMKVQAYRQRAKKLLKCTFLAWKSLLRTSHIAREVHAEHVERKSKIQSFMQRLGSAPTAQDVDATTVNTARTNHTASSKPRAISNSRGGVRNQPPNKPPSRTVWVAEDGHSRSQQREEAGRKADRRPTRTTTTAVAPSSQPNTSHRKVSIVDKAAPPSHKNEEEDIDVPRGDEHYADDFEIEVDEELHILPRKPSRASLPTNDLPPPPSYRHFARSPSGGAGSPKEGFNVENNLKAQAESQATQKALDHLSRKERLAILRQQAMDRVQHKKKEDEEHRRKERETKELRELEKIKEEAQKKQAVINAKTNPRIAAMNEETKRLVKVADNFRRRRLLVVYGLAPWLRYMNSLSDKQDVAVQHYEHKLLYHCWQQLAGYVVAIKTERYRKEYRFTSIAVSHYRRRWLKTVWRAWKLYGKSLKAKAIAVTGMFSRYTLVKRSWQAWKIALERSKREEVHQLRSVSRRGDRCALRYYLRIWKDFMKEVRYDREINLRTEQKWRSVQQWMSYK